MAKKSRQSRPITKIEVYSLIVIVVIVLIPIFILFHQYTVYGVFFNISDVFHHENIAIFIFLTGIGFLIAIFIVNANIINQRSF